MGRGRSNKRPRVGARTSAATLAVFGLGAALAPALAQAPGEGTTPTPQPTPTAAASDQVVMVLDFSRSMWGEIQAINKVDIVKDAFEDLLDEWPADRYFGLVGYGHRNTACDDAQTLVEPGPLDARDLNRRLEPIWPNGRAPLTAALRLAASELTPAAGPGTLVVITDGGDNCEADPCSLLGEWRASGGAPVVHIVGMGLTDESRQEIACLWEGSGGRYFSIASVGDFEGAMREVAAARRDAAATPPLAQLPAAPEPAPEAAPVPETGPGAWVEVAALLSTELGADVIPPAEAAPAPAPEALAHAEVPEPAPPRAVEYFGGPRLDLAPADLEAPAPAEALAEEPAISEVLASAAAAEPSPAAPPTPPELPAGPLFPAPLATAPAPRAEPCAVVLVRDDGSGPEATAAPPPAVLTGPTTTSAGAALALRWTGAVAPGDFMTIVPAGADEGTWSLLGFPDAAGGVGLRAPDRPGDYELRYVSAADGGTRARRSLSVTTVDAHLSAPLRVRPGDPIPVGWRGPGYPGDFLTIVQRGTEEGRWGYYAYTEAGTPVTLRAPEESGTYEIRYVLDQSGRTLASVEVAVAE
jgi:Ca-activated chloride channel family protein